MLKSGVCNLGVRACWLVVFLATLYTFLTPLSCYLFLLFLIPLFLCLCQIFFSCLGENLRLAMEAVLRGNNCLFLEHAFREQNRPEPLKNNLKFSQRSVFESGFRFSIAFYPSLPFILFSFFLCHWSNRAIFIGNRTHLQRLLFFWFPVV